MNKRMPVLAMMLAVIVLGHAAQATVIISETLAEKVGQSKTVALAEVTGIEGQTPFNNAHRPVVDLRVLRAWRGAQPGERLQISEWSDSPAFVYYANGLPPTQAQIDGARKQWEAAAVVPPQVGEQVLVLLGQQEGAPSFAGTGYPDHLVRPDERTLEMVDGFLTYSVELRPEDDLRADKGMPIAASLVVQNLSTRAVTFNPASIRLSATTPQGNTFDHVAPTVSTKSGGTSIPAQGKVTIQVDWRALYRGLFTAPGDYWLTIEIPAQGGERLQRHVVISEHSVADACGRADQIARVRLKSMSGNDVAFEDPIYLRRRGEALAPSFARSADFAVAATGQRWILCAVAGQVRFAVPDTTSVREQLAQLLANDPLEWWSNAEDSDPRFAAPASQADGPASVVHLESLQRRLQELR